MRYIPSAIGSQRNNLYSKILFFFFVIAAFSARAQDTTLTQYTGKYVFPEGSSPADAQVTFDGNNLTITASLGTANLKHLSGDSFSIPQYNGTVDFLRDSTQKVTGIKVQISVADIDVEGKRVLDAAAEDKKDKQKKVNKVSVSFGRKQNPATGLSAASELAADLRFRLPELPPSRG